MLILLVSTSIANIPSKWRDEFSDMGVQDIPFWLQLWSNTQLLVMIEHCRFRKPELHFL